MVPRKFPTEALWISWMTEQKISNDNAQKYAKLFITDDVDLDILDRYIRRSADISKDDLYHFQALLNSHISNPENMEISLPVQQPGTIYDLNSNISPQEPPEISEVKMEASPPDLNERSWNEILYYTLISLGGKATYSEIKSCLWDKYEEILRTRKGWQQTVAGRLSVNARNWWTKEKIRKGNKNRFLFIALTENHLNPPEKRRMYARSKVEKRKRLVMEDEDST